MSTPSPAEIGAVDRRDRAYRSRTASLAEPLIGTPQEDLLATLYEAERALKTALRALQRGQKLLAERHPDRLRSTAPRDATEITEIAISPKNGNGPLRGRRTAMPGGGSRHRPQTRWREPGW